MKNIIWIGDPVMLSLWGFNIHWYGVFFGLALVSGLRVMKVIYLKEGVPVESLDALFVYSALGIAIGARLGHCFFYDPSYYIENPLKIFAVWEGGLASHGGGLGLIITIIIYHKITGIKFFWIMDRVSLATPVFCFFVRMGNFFNSEILGMPTNAPWAIVFSRIDNIPRHPVQLYEAFSYLTIFFILVLIYKFTNIIKRPGVIFGFSLFFGLTVRFLLEFFKVQQTNYNNDFFLSAGQVLSIPFLIGGFIVFIIALKNSKPEHAGDV